MHNHFLLSWTNKTYFHLIVDPQNHLNSYITFQKIIQSLIKKSLIKLRNYVFDSVMYLLLFLMHFQEDHFHEICV